MLNSVVFDPPEPARELMAATLRSALAQAAPPRWLLEHPVCLASPGARQVLWAFGRKLSRNPDVGFTVADGVPAEAIGSLWTLYQQAPSLRMLAENYPGWAPLLLDFVDLTVHDEHDCIWFRMTARDVALDRAEQDFRASMLAKTWRALARSSALNPRAVHFTYPRPGSMAAHRQALGDTTLRFEQPWFQLGLTRARAEVWLPGADPLGFAMQAEHARRAVRGPRSETLAERAEALITERLKGPVRERDVAHALGLSERSLRRELARVGTSFRELLSRARLREHELYTQALLPKSEIACLLGLANRGALRNALRRIRAPGEREQSALRRS